MNNNLPSSELVIRPASFLDIPYIHDIAYKTWPTTYGNLLGQEQVEYMLQKIYSANSLEEQIKNQHYFFLALKEYSPVGFASFSNVGSKVYKLQKIYVLPTEQKSGIGLALLTTVETVAKSKGATKLQLNVNRKNNAKSFYEKQGFGVLKEEDIDIGNGFFMNDYIMEKELI